MNRLIRKNCYKFRNDLIVIVDCRVTRRGLGLTLLCRLELSTQMVGPGILANNLSMFGNNPYSAYHCRNVSRILQRNIWNVARNNPETMSAPVQYCRKYSCNISGILQELFLQHFGNITGIIPATFREYYRNYSCNVSGTRAKNVCVCGCVCVRACMRVCVGVRACVRGRVRARVCVRLRVRLVWSFTRATPGTSSPQGDLTVGTCSIVSDNIIYVFELIHKYTTFSECSTAN